jgi:hypothetical protein
MSTDTLSRRHLLASVPAVAAAAVPAAATALGGLPAGGPCITHEQLAAQDFEPIPSFVGFSSDEQQKQKLEKFLADAAFVVRVSARINERTKAEVIELVKQMDASDDAAESDEMLKLLVDGRENVQELVAMLEGAEVRFAIAMANVYTEAGELRAS